MEVLSETSINKWIVPQLSLGKRGPRLQVAASKVIGAILYKLKTGCQWRLLPVKELLGASGLGWQGVYYHFHRWAQDGSLRRMWVGWLLNLEFGAVVREPDHLQERWRVHWLPGQQSSQNLQNPVSDRQYGLAFDLHLPIGRQLP